MISFAVIGRGRKRGSKLKYEVELLSVNDFTEKLTIENVKGLDIAEGVYYMGNNEGETVFTAPINRVIYIRKVQ